ncbi:MAG TPA: PVC-type heme-binding CxxCH protein, partial [Candidatus Synoicihabitans sp.]|nr:PVC-type heme-binding CxxCH protein [Candidatus Synoicihabitans sp.]
MVLISYPWRLLFIVSFVTLGVFCPARSDAASPGHELVLHRWSGELNVPDPVACAVDPQGRVYVTSTTRRKTADLDIREHPMWTAADVGLTSVAEKRAFFHDALAPGKVLRPRGGLGDHNQDGGIDWRDLTVHTERIYQLRDTDGDGTADRMTVFAEGFNTEVTGIAAGVLWHDGWLYATIAPDLWRLKDVDDDGVADIREVVVHGFGVHIAYGGHDMHGLSVGPDGRIYWSIGDKGAHVTSREGRVFSHPNEGAVFRAEPDGSGFEVYAHGLRNPQEPAFDAFGNLFVVDNDADMEGERERFMFLAEASDGGWRCNYQYMGLASPWMRERLWQPAFEGQAAYMLTPIASYSDGPAGFEFDPGTALSDAQRNTFIMTQFPSGLMRGFRVEPDGASFRMVSERTMHRGVMGVGVSWHPDGSLMMVDWIGGYPLDGLGAVWRVEATGERHPQRAPTAAILRAGFDSVEQAQLVDWLGHADQRVRLGAQFELVKRERASELLALATDSTMSQLARIHGLWGYGQLLRRETADTAPLEPLLREGDAEIRAQAVKVLGDAATGKGFAEIVTRLLEDPSPRVRLHAAIALGKWRVPAAVPKLVEMAARDGADPTLRHAVVTGLAGCANPTELVALARHESRVVRLVSVVTLRRLAAPEVRIYLSDRDGGVVEEAARAIHDDRGIAAALEDLAALLTPNLRSDVVRRRALNANFRLGTAAAAARLREYGLMEEAPQESRQEALTLLRLWNEPPPLDRVDGYARQVQPMPIRDVLAPRLDALLALGDPTLKTLAIELMIAHALEPTPAQIDLIVADARAPGELRAQALRLMADRYADDPLFAQQMEVALSPSAPDALFETGLELLAVRDTARFVQVAREALRTRRTETGQRALRLLSEVRHQAADTLLLDEGRRLLAGEYPGALRMDLLEALEKRAAEDARHAEALARYAASAEAAERTELLEGGDVARGRDIARDHLAANCLACHRLESAEGSEVGPNLRTIGDT